MRVIRFFILILIAGIVGYYIGVNKISFDWKQYKPSISVVNKEPPSSLSNLDMDRFWTVFQKVQEGYYDKKAIDADKMLNGAITGMVNSLDDPYTVFLPPTQNKDFKQMLSGQFSGIGAELGLRDKQVVVVAPIDGSPAQKAGIKSGDAILKVNDDATSGWTLTQTVEKIRGPKGTQVALTVQHKNESTEKIIKIIRDTITVKSVAAWVKEVGAIDQINKPAALSAHQKDKIAYIRLSQFGDNTNQEWLTTINALSLDMQKKGAVKGLILDLRNNPGGYVNDAVFIASEFLKMGSPVVIQDYGSGKEESLVVKRGGLLMNTPLVVLINKGSASASEIVAGALRDYDRATLVGEQSFGKGTMQNAEDLGNGSGIHVTIARWLTPKKSWVGNGKNGEGLKPDIVVTLDSKDQSHDAQLEKAVEILTKK
ncbi:MAG: S41 family peptidase [Candidatus Levybacteria bacterium]|nr:S41 family peptidase [Candidatus Levybacteria bacterium]